MRSSTLTVYILTYNRAKYLECTIESVLRQTYENYDLYVLDNCSTDNTPNIIKKFNDSRLHYIRHEKNIGGIGNIQFAIKHCTTDFMIIFHDDDIMKPDLLRKEVEILSQDISISAVSCNATFMDDEGTKSNQLMFIDNDIRLYSSGELFRSCLTNHKWLCFPTIMYRHSFLKENRITFHEEAGPCGDVILYCDIERYGGKICEIPDALIYYRQHSDQDSLNSSGLMQLMLFRYINSIPYYANILEECSNVQPQLYCNFIRMILSKAINYKYNKNEALNLIRGFDGILKHKKIDEWIAKICIAINYNIQKTTSFLLNLIHKFRIRRIK